MAAAIRRIIFCVTLKLADGERLVKTGWLRQAHRGWPPSPRKRGVHLGGSKASGSAISPGLNEAAQDARYSRQERIEVRPFLPKGFSAVRQIGSCFIVLGR